MSFVAKLYHDDRLAERYPVTLDGTLRNPQAEPQDVVIDELSVTGFRTASAHGLAVGDIITLGVFGVGLRNARVQRESNENYGCQFLQPLSVAELNVALGGLTAPAPVVLHKQIPNGLPGATAIGLQLSPATEWSLSPRMRLATIAAVGIIPWTILWLSWSVL